MKIMVMIACALSAQLFSASTEAACTLAQADLSGTWRIYSANVQNAAQFWNRCQLVIGATGGLGKTGSFCIGADGGRIAFTGGKLTLNTTTCLISGYVDSDFGRTKITEVTLGAGKNFLAGVGIGIDQQPFTLTGIKR